jgi:hypothetical protein
MISSRLAPANVVVTAYTVGAATLAMPVTRLSVTIERGAARIIWQPPAKSNRQEARSSVSCLLRASAGSFAAHTSSSTNPQT